MGSDSQRPSSPYRRPTRADVAKEAGVAGSTVSLILTGRGDDLSIPQSTQQRVRDAALRLGYVPNKLIGAVRRGRTNLIGVYLRWEQWSVPFGYWVETMMELQRAVSDSDLQLLIHNATKELTSEEAYARQAGGIVDGVLVLNSAKDAIADRLADSGLPAVEVGDTFSRLPFVGVDGALGVRLAVDHVWDRGRRRPIFVGHASQYHEDQLSRSQAFVESMNALDASIEWAERCLSIENDDDPTPAVLAAFPECDAVVCSSDDLAFRLYWGLQGAGRRVPDDVSIIAFDALRPIGGRPILTSIATPRAEMARLALEKLQKVISGEPFEHGTVLKPTLRLGETG
ncbi:MAG: LacI family transcriptional regulator [Fimbriimonadaceae bacterium]|nr:LacI family transcriptional regulator [Fimbriimonadaceae bacterium]